MKENAEPPPSPDHSGIASFGTRIRSDESWLDHPALHDLSHTKIARFGCAALAIGVLVVLGMIVVPVVNSIRSANRAEVAMAKAYRELTAQKFPAAIASYTVALGERLRTSDRAIAYGNHGWSYRKIERDAEAIRDFSSALQIEPNLLFARLDRGLAYHRAGRFTEALADYDKTIALDPNALDAYENRSSIYALSGATAGSHRRPRGGHSLQSQQSSLVRRARRLYLRNGELETARTSYETWPIARPEMDGKSSGTLPQIQALPRSPVIASLTTSHGARLPRSGFR